MQDEDTVVVERDGDVWAEVPDTISSAFSRGVERIRRVRGEIVEASPISWMPRVVVRGEVWLSNDGGGSINGMMGFINTPEDHEVSAVLPAQVVLASDPFYQRDRLVHEFSHCFDYFRRAVDAMDAGLETVRGPAWGYELDERADRECLADPRDWFGDRDVREFKFWRVGTTDVSTIDEYDLRTHLPVRQPDRKPNVAGPFYIPNVVAEKARELRVLGRPFGFGLAGLRG